MFGVALLIVLFVRTDFFAMLHALARGGWQLAWLLPYRALFFLLFVIGWWWLLQPYNREHRAGFGYLLWVAAVRDAVDRLLPVASVGGGVVGVRLIRWRGISAVAVGATIITEMLLTVAVLYVMAALGLVLTDFGGNAHQHHRLTVALISSAPIPIVSAYMLHSGAVFERLERYLRPLLGDTIRAEDATALDQELRACLRRVGVLLAAWMLQLGAFLSGAFEIWLALRLFGHPVGLQASIALECVTQAARHLAFFIPGGLGVQETGLIIFGQAFGIGSELMMAASMTKRAREILVGLPSLISWQWFEAKRLRTGS